MKNIFNPNTKSYKILFGITCVVATVTAGFLISRAGSLNPTSAPGDTMVSLDDIYCRLTGCTPTAYGIDSPANPAGTMHTLSEINTVTPDFKNSPGNVTAAEVWTGKTYYTNSATRQTGTLTLTGNATAASVKSGLTFYSNSLTILTGTAPYTAGCAYKSSGTCLAACQAAGYSSCLNQNLNAACMVIGTQTQNCSSTTFNGGSHPCICFN